MCRSRSGTRRPRAPRARTPTTCAASSRRRSRRCSPPTCRPSSRIDAGRDADAADGEFPLVLFSHGFTGIRQQSSLPDLAPRQLGHGRRRARPLEPGPLPRAGRVPRRARATSATRSTTCARRRDLLAAEDESDDSLLAGHVGTDEVAAVGHSAGGGTVLGFAADDGVVGYVSLASGRARRSGDGDDTHSLPDTPSLFVAGRLDGVVPWDTVTRPRTRRRRRRASCGCSTAWATTGSTTSARSAAAPGSSGWPTRRAWARSSTRNRSSGPSARTAASRRPSRSPRRSRSSATSSRRGCARPLGLDAEPVGLGPDVAGAYPVAVEIESKP